MGDLQVSHQLYPNKLFIYFMWKHKQTNKIKQQQIKKKHGHSRYCMSKCLVSFNSGTTLSSLSSQASPESFLLSPQSFCLFLLLFVFLRQGPSVQLGTLYVCQAGFKLTKIPLSASSVLVKAVLQHSWLLVLINITLKCFQHSIQNKSITSFIRVKNAANDVIKMLVQVNKRRLRIQL